MDNESKLVQYEKFQHALGLGINNAYLTTEEAENIS